MNADANRHHNLARVDAAPRRRQATRWAPSILSLATTGVAASALFVFPGWYLYAVRCDEGCSGSLYGWAHDPQAWQWSAQFWGLAVPGVVAALLVSFLLARRRIVAGSIALAASALLYAGWAVVGVMGRHAQVSARDVVLHPWEWLPYTVMVIGGVLSILLARTLLNRDAAAT